MATVEMKINLPEYLVPRLQARVDSREYSSTEDVVVAAVGLYEEDAPFFAMTEEDLEREMRRSVAQFEADEAAGAPTYTIEEVKQPLKDHGQRRAAGRKVQR